MNKYPYWKYLAIIFILVLGLLYALPNMYGYDAAIQIAHKDVINSLTIHWLWSKTH